MLELGAVFLAAWKRIRPMLDADPVERNRRLARLSSAAIQNPPREWCLTLRANDTRLESLAIAPHDAPGERAAHEIHLTRGDLLYLCRPVVSDCPGSSTRDLAGRLGVKVSAVLAAARRGQVRVRRVRGLGGKRDCRGGIPVVTSVGVLNPTAGEQFRCADPVWGSLWFDLPDRVSEGFAQAVERVPVFKAMDSAARLRALDGRMGGDGHTSTDAFGAGLRAEPACPAPACSDRPVMGLSMASAAEAGLPARFWGWAWRCPGCRRTCRVIHLPIAVPLPRFVRSYFRRHAPTEELETRVEAFGCARCHRVRPGVSWIELDGLVAWNAVVTRVSGGLLYGHEVERPAWVGGGRRRARRARVGARRIAVLGALARGLGDAAAARELGMTVAAVRTHVARARAMVGARTRAALVERLKAGRVVGGVGLEGAVGGLRPA